MCGQRFKYRVLYPVTHPRYPISTIGLMLKHLAPLPLGGSIDPDYSRFTHCPLPARFQEDRAQFYMWSSKNTQRSGSTSPLCLLLLSKLLCISQTNEQKVGSPYAHTWIEKRRPRMRCVVRDDTTCRQICSVLRAGCSVYLSNTACGQQSLEGFIP